MSTLNREEIQARLAKEFLIPFFEPGRLWPITLGLTWLAVWLVWQA